MMAARAHAKQKELNYGAPGFSADMQRKTLQATVYSGDRCRRVDAQSLALMIEVDSRKSALKLAAQSALPLSILHEGLNVD
jgi:hypothetical protein